MNNSFLSVEDTPKDNSEFLSQQETKDQRILSAVQEVKKTQGWSTLKTEIFGGKVESLRRELQIEALKVNPDGMKLNRIAGQLEWAERFFDMDKWEAQLALEIRNIKKMQHGQSE